MGRWLRLVLLTALLLVPVALWPGPAGAQDGSERIDRYDVVVRIEDSGALLVTETIDYDFGAATGRHGIFRDIPVRLRFDDSDDRVYPLEVLGVEGSEGTPDQYEVQDSGPDRRIRIGDPDRTVSGRHTYEITYRMEAVLNGFPDHDELYWNAVGGEWTVPITAASATVEAPDGVTQVACFAGPLGSSLACADATSDGRTARFSSASLGPGEAFTVVVAFPTGVVPPPQAVLEERWSLQRAFSLTPVTLGGAAGLLVLALGTVAALAWRHGRDRRWAGAPTDVAFGPDPGVVGTEEVVPLFGGGETPVEFVPPDGLRPGQVGTLVDEVAHPLDVTATIVDLAVRGYLRIEEIPKEGWFGSADWRLVRLQPDDELLRAYERLLLTGLFQDGGEVTLSSLRNTFASRLEGVRNALYDDAVAEGWFLGRPDAMRIRWAVLGGVVFLAGVGLTGLAAARTSLGLVPIPIAIGGLLLLACHRVMPRRTAKGHGTLRRVHGFRRFIDESEKDRARFAEQQHLFSEYLPYAVVFGATDKWARAFAGLDGLPPNTGNTGWYVGHHPWNTFAVASAMDDFAVTTSGTITSSPSGSGSSGFGGGGFSGGGGGGGGGGSW